MDQDGSCGAGETQRQSSWEEEDRHGRAGRCLLSQDTQDEYGVEGQAIIGFHMTRV